MNEDETDIQEKDNEQGSKYLKYLQDEEDSGYQRSNEEVDDSYDANPNQCFCCTSRVVASGQSEGLSVTLLQLIYPNTCLWLFGVINGKEPIGIIVSLVRFPDRTIEHE